MQSRQNISSNSPLEAVFGYSRAVRIGNQVLVSGTTAIQPDGSVAGGDDPYLQAKAALATIEAALQAGGASFEDVVRPRVYVTNMADLEAIARAHAEAFGSVRPASTGVEVAALARPELIVEIEADAIIE